MPAGTAPDRRVAAAGCLDDGNGCEHLVSHGDLTGLPPSLTPGWPNPDDLLVATASAVGSSALGSAVDCCADRLAEGNSGAQLSAPNLPPCGGSRRVSYSAEVSGGSATVGSPSRDVMDEAEEFLIDDPDSSCTPATTAPVGTFGGALTVGGSGAFDSYPAPGDNMVFTTDSPMLSGPLSQLLVVPSGSGPGGSVGMLKSPTVRTSALLRRAVATPGTPQLSQHRGASPSLPTVGMTPALATMLESSALNGAGRIPAVASMRRIPALVAAENRPVLSSLDGGCQRASLATLSGDLQAHTIASAMTAALARGVAEPGGQGRSRLPRLAPAAEAPRKRPRLGAPTIQVCENSATIGAAAGRAGQGAPRSAMVASVSVATASSSPPTVVAARPPADMTPLLPAVPTTVPTEAATSTEVVSSACLPPSTGPASSVASGSDGDGRNGAATDATHDPSVSWEPVAGRPVQSASLASRLVTTAADQAMHVIGSSAGVSASVAAAAAAAGTARAAFLSPAVSVSPFTSALDGSSQLIVTLSRSLSWNQQCSEWNWCESWRFPDVTARLITVGAGSLSVDGAPPDCPLIAYLTVALEGASEDESPESVGLVSSDGLTTDVERLVLDQKGVAHFSCLRLAIDSAAVDGRRCRLVVRVERAGVLPSGGVVLAAGGDGGVSGEAADVERDPPASAVVASAMSVPFRVFGRRQITEEPSSRAKVDRGGGGCSTRRVRRASVLGSRADGGGGVGSVVDRAGSVHTQASVPCGGSLLQPALTSATSDQSLFSRGGDDAGPGDAFPVGGGGVPHASLMAIAASGAAASAAGSALATRTVTPPPSWVAPAPAVPKPVAATAGAAGPVITGTLPPLVVGSTFPIMLPQPVATAAVDGLAATAEALPAVAAAHLPTSFLLDSAPAVQPTSIPSPAASGATAAVAVPVLGWVPPAAGPRGGDAMPAAGAAVAIATAGHALPALARARQFLRDSLRLAAADRAAAAAAVAPPPVLDMAAAAAEAFTSELTLLHDRTRALLAALQSATCATVSGGGWKRSADRGAVTASPRSAGSGSTDGAWPAQMPDSVRLCFSNLKNELALYATLSSLLFKELASRLPRVCESYELDLSAHVALVQVAEGGNSSSGDSAGRGGGAPSSTSAAVGSGVCADDRAAGASADPAATYRVGDHGSDSGGYDAAASFLASHRLATVVGSHLDKVAVHLLPLFKAHFSPIELALLGRRLSAARSRGAMLLATN